MISIELSRIISSSYDIIGKFCINYCNGMCCKEGFLRLNKKEAESFIKKYPKNIISDKDNLVIFSTHPKCPFLTEYHKCKLYKSKKRPSICKDYPMKVIDNKENPLFIFHPSCKAVSTGALNENIKKIRDLGYIVIC